MQRSTLLFRAAVRNSAERVLVVSLPTLMATACITPLDDPVGGTTDAPESPACFAGENCNGVKLWCRNQNEGADESGGDGGSAPNYWWER